MKRLTSVVCIIVGGMASPHSGFAADGLPPWSVKRTEQGVLILEGKSKVLFYQAKPKSHEGKYARANYVHPLYDLDGRVLSEDFPADHRHHRGVFWAWHQLWVGDKKIGDPWTTKDSVWDVKRIETLQPGDAKRPGTAGLRAHVLWKSPRWKDAAGKQKPLVQETTVIRVHRAQRDSRRIDFEISLLALEDRVRIGGSEDAKGYGGFSTRVVLPADVRFLARTGEVTPQRTAIEAGPWMDVSGTYGKPGRTAGMAILCHPSSPGFPQRWILRGSRSMQNPAYPGREPAPLSRKTPLVFRYRLVLHRGWVEKPTLETWFKQYAAAKSPVVERPN